MTTREQLAEEYAKKMAELDQSEAIKKLIPDSVIPKLKSVTIQHKSAPWIGFRNEGYGMNSGLTFKEAMEIFDAFPVKVAMEHRKGMYTQIQPLSEYKDKDLKGSVLKGTYCAQLRNGGANHSDHYSNRMEMVFYAMLGVTLVRVYVELKPMFSPKVVIKRGFGDRIESKTFEFNQVMYSQADGWVSYSCYENGPIKKTYDHHYLIVADDEECTQFDHLRGVMQSLATERQQEEW